MKPSALLAKHLKEVYFGDNWTGSNLKQHLEGVTWQQATMPVQGLNTIATLVYHMTYYVRAVIMVLEGRPLDAKDAYSFDHPPIRSQADWDQFLEQVWADVEILAAAIGQMPEDSLWEDFYDNKYGTYYRNLLGVIEHCHYHLGQLVLIKKMLMHAEDG